MSMLSKMLIASLVFLSHASFALQSVDTVISDVSFDGKILTYSYIAYDTEKILSESASVICNYAPFDSSDKLFLKSIDIKLSFSAEFNSPFKKIVKDKGRLDVQEEIQKCITRLGDKTINGEYPVTVNLPKISVSSSAK